MAKTYKVHPRIGIARVGNSPDFFLGPEKPLAPPDPPGGFKDFKCRVKRQAVRFRVFEYSDDPSILPVEITSDKASVTWTVGVTGNHGHSGDKVLTKLSQSDRLEGSAIDFSDPALGNVLLGEIQTDEQGRLLFLPGFGWAHASSLITGSDDTCEGWVKASVHIDGKKIEAKGAWVVTAPPKFAPRLDSVITLWDETENRLLGSAGLPTPTSYTQHIYPILLRAQSAQWVFSAAATHHQWDLTDVASLPRDDIFRALQIPPDVEPPDGVANGFMPAFGMLTRLQYLRMQDFWAENSLDDWTGPPGPTGGDPTPDELDRAALEACVGSPFNPGIEVDGRFTDPASYETADPTRVPHVTSGGAPRRAFRYLLQVPWQADFSACLEWPIVRPIQALRTNSDGSLGYEDWPPAGANQTFFLNSWHTLGFIVEDAESGQFVERQCVGLATPHTPDRTFRDPLSIVRRILAFVDPAPPDLGRIREVVSDVLARVPAVAADELSDLVQHVDSIAEHEMPAALLKVRASLARLETAAKLLEEKLKQPRK